MDIDDMKLKIKDVTLISVWPTGNTVTVEYVIGDGIHDGFVVSQSELKGKSGDEIKQYILDREKDEFGSSMSNDMVRVGDQSFPIQVDQDVDMYDQRPRTKDNLPFNTRHRKRLRNESGGMAENDFDGMAGGTRNQNRGMGTDQSYSIPGQGIGGAAIGY